MRVRKSVKPFVERSPRENRTRLAFLQPARGDRPDAVVGGSSVSRRERQVRPSSGVNHASTWWNAPVRRDR